MLGKLWLTKRFRLLMDIYVSWNVLTVGATSIFNGFKWLLDLFRSLRDLGSSSKIVRYGFFCRGVFRPWGILSPWGNLFQWSKKCKLSGYGSREEISNSSVICCWGSFIVGVKSTFLVMLVIELYLSSYKLRGRFLLSKLFWCFTLFRKFERYRLLKRLWSLGQKGAHRLVRLSEWYLLLWESS